MPDKITFYAMVDGRSTVDEPVALLRRLEFDNEGFSDEGLRSDFSWEFTAIIIEWENGGFAGNLIEVSHKQSEKIIAYFREKWGPYGQLHDGNAPPR